jgi:crotonobetainyl-CoA:carnitine CoA-transferase CaiB-like acyl-CoA transferase
MDGMTVIELASVLAGPSVCQFLAELGATVIKVLLDNVLSVSRRCIGMCSGSRGVSRWRTSAPVET